MLLLPKYRVRTGSLKLPVFTGFIAMLYILYYSNFINIANYSFLSYSFGGFPVSSPFLDLIKYSRLPVLIFGGLVLSLLVVRDKLLRSFFIENWDVLLFGIVLYFGLVNSSDFFTGLSYSIWHSNDLCFGTAFLFKEIFYEN